MRRSSIVEAVGVLATCATWAKRAVLIFAGQDSVQREGPMGSSEDSRGKELRTGGRGEKE